MIARVTGAAEGATEILYPFPATHVDLCFFHFGLRRWDIKGSSFQVSAFSLAVRSLGLTF